jgi:hypothetical protein
MRDVILISFAIGLQVQSLTEQRLTHLIKTFLLIHSHFQNTII